MSLIPAVIGKTGQLARAVLREGEALGHNITALDREAMALTANPVSIEAKIESLPSDLDAVIIAAAYTAVDMAETNPDIAYAVNAAAPAAIARACARHDIPLVHISTDYVFSGDGHQPYEPDDDTDPLGVYGASKLDGELAVLESGAKATILRTSWVFDGVGKNFLTTMLRLSETHDELRVVDDQIGRPTYAGHLALAALKAAETLANEPDFEPGIYHVTGGGEPISWADFAISIFESTDQNVHVERIPTSEYPTPAERPSYSVLDTDSFERNFHHPLPDWQNGLTAALQERIDE